MQINKLIVTHIRNIHQAEIQPSPTINGIIGENGSGKTSLLEAIHILATGKSFRNHQIQRIITNTQQESTIFATINERTRLGIQKTRQGETTIRINEEKQRSIAELARRLPIIVLHPESYRIITGTPKERRQLLDWGVFHVEPAFLEKWRRYSQIVKQRNAALRQGTSDDMVVIWDEQLAELANSIDRYRQTYVEHYFSQIKKITQSFLNYSITFSYNRGWQSEISLKEVLTKTIRQDRKLGYTTHGPHNAELKVNIDSYGLAKDYLSRGQLKLLVLAMKLAQGEVLREQANKMTLYLIDDIASEFDEKSVELTLQTLYQLQAQVFITALDKTIFMNLTDSAKMFHVEQGNLVGVL